MDFPTLYKKTSVGAIQTWQISTKENEIITTYGQLGTLNPQTTTDVITKGKNIGRSNATTPIQQAELEAKAKHEKQLKAGYVQSLADAENGVVDEIIEGGVLPMLAHSYDDHGSKIKFPCYGQPKFDGTRTICVISKGKCSLFSRTRKLITSVPHINKALEQLFPDQDIILDGELYAHEYKKEFEKIVSIVRQEEPIEGHEIVQYHIYDVPSLTTNQEQRNNFLQNLELKEPLVRVLTVEINNKEELKKYHDLFVEEGYEGLILRNKKGLYENKRSYDLQKYKEFLDAEFKILGMEEGRGKLTGHIGAFICEMPDGKQFKCKMTGSTEKLREYFLNKSLWFHKSLTVKYQGLTAYGIPRFPVGIAIRDYE